MGRRLDADTSLGAYSVQAQDKEKIAQTREDWRLQIHEKVHLNLMGYVSTWKSSAARTSNSEKWKDGLDPSQQ